VLEALERHRPTATVLPPTMLRMVMDDPDFARYDKSSLTTLYYGSSPMPVEWIRDAIERFPDARIIQGYGLTETAPILTVLDWPTHRRAVTSGSIDVLRSAGRPVADTWLRVVDDAGRDLPTGEIGEVLARGPQVMSGYLNLPEATAEALRNGWFHTGDVGRIDAQGFLYLSDRLGDKIITGGENVYSTEVEAALYTHPGVAECAVVAVPDAKLGEALLGVIVAREPATLDAETLIAHCRERIGGYKIPRRYVFVDALPKSAMGKILKVELRRRYRDGG
jgi:long-chain acyl-CoA synthetase